MRPASAKRTRSPAAGPSWRHASERADGPTNRLGLYLRRDLPQARKGCSPHHAQMQHGGPEPAHLAEIAAQIAPGAHAALLVRSGRLASVGPARRAPPNITLILPLPATMSGAQSRRENAWQFLRDNWLSNRIFKSYHDVVDHCCESLEQPRRSTLADHVHRPSQLGPWVLINESWYKPLAALTPPIRRRIVFETGRMAPILFHGLSQFGLPVVCVESRQAYQALKSLVTHKTDRNDARGLAHLARTGFFKPVHVKSLSAHAVRSLIIARKKLVGQRVTLENQIRGLAVVFGIRLPRALAAAFIDQALKASEGVAGLSAAMRGLIAARTAVMTSVAAIDADMRRMTRASAACRRLMTIPGVGQLTALAFVAAIDDPSRIRRSRDIGAYLGLVPKRYQSGEVDYTGGISKCGDRRLRTLLYEAANVMLTRYKASSNSRTGPSRSPSDQRCAKRGLLWLADSRSLCMRCCGTGPSSHRHKPAQSTRQEAESSSHEGS